MVSVRIEHLHKVYPPDVVALESLTLDIKNGEFVVFLGPSGCGKTTALQVIAGLETVTSGRIFFDSVNVTRVPTEKRDIAMVFQSYALYPNKTAYENMGFGLKMKRWPKADIDTRVREVARTLDLAEVLHRKPGQLSGGQRQRVALGRAIVREPKLFLLDEPLSNVDAKLRGQMRRELKALHRDLNATFIYVTHDQVEAMSMGDRVAVFREGVLQQFDTPMGIYRQPANLFVAGFVGSPPMNLVGGRLDDSPEARFACSGQDGPGLQYRWATPPWPDALRGSEVILGFRPTDVKVRPPSGQPGHYRGQVVLTEPLGSDLLLSVAHAGKPLVIRADPDFDVRDGEEVDLLIPESSIHLFSAESGARIADRNEPADRSQLASHGQLADRNEREPA